jgi:hypothetical protein
LRTGLESGGGEREERRSEVDGCGNQRQNLVTGGFKNTQEVQLIRFHK